MEINTKFLIEIYKIFIESLRVYVPPERWEDILYQYNRSDFALSRSAKDLKKGTFSFYVYQAMLLSEAVLNLRDITFYKFKGNSFIPFIDEHYIQKKFNSLFYCNGREGEDSIYCDRKALHYLNRFNSTNFYDPSVCDSPMLARHQQFVTFTLDTQNLKEMPQCTVEEWNKLIDNKWHPENYPESNFSVTKKGHLLAYLPKTRE